MGRLGGCDVFLELVWEDDVSPVRCLHSPDPEDPRKPWKYRKILYSFSWRMALLHFLQQLRYFSLISLGSNDSDAYRIHDTVNNRTAERPMLKEAMKRVRMFVLNSLRVKR